MTKKIIIGLVGETGSGKDTVANHISKRYGVPLLRFADPLKKTLSTLVEHPSKEDHAWLYGALKERFGENVLHNALRRQIVGSTHEVLCVNGLRMPKDEDFIRSFNMDYIIYITADQQMRWERSVSRGEKADDDQSFGEFQKFEATAQTEKAVPEIGSRADFTIINDDSLDTLLIKVNEIMDKIMK
jgi:dephospho-CoA kinase